MSGAVWPGATHFPDFLHPKADDYWTKQYRTFHEKLPFDGSWIDMVSCMEGANGS